MHILYKEETSKKLGELDSGDVFIYEKHLYIKTDTEQCGLITCITPKNGCLYALNEGISVEPVRCTLEVEATEEYVKNHK